MTNTLRRRIVLLGLLAAPLLATPALAQSPTPEGTVITNTATATFTDANNNTYASVTASASVTVGVQLATTVTPSAASQTPASPSTGNTVAFTIANAGNANRDTVQVTATIGAGITITAYALTVNGAVVGSYATLAQLNTALGQNGIDYASTAVVTATYTVATGRGGLSSDVTLTATSQRTPTPPGVVTPASGTVTITPTVAAAVAVTPDNGTTSRLPSNGTQYSETFTVANNGNASDTFTLTGSTTGTAITIVSVNGSVGSASSATIAAGASASITVVYTVANAAPAGPGGTLVLTATSANDGAVSDPGQYTLTVVRSAIAMTKVPYRDDGVTVIAASDRVVPGEYVRYLITVTNTGAAPASGVSVSDPLNAQLTYDSATGDAAGWTLTYNGGTTTITGALSGTLAASASRSFWVRARIR